MHGQLRRTHSSALEIRKEVRTLALFISGTCVIVDEYVQRIPLFLAYLYLSNGQKATTPVRCVWKRELDFWLGRCALHGSAVLAQTYMLNTVGLGCKRRHSEQV